MTKAEIGLALRRARTNAGLTQAALARKVGTSQPALARAESGLVEPSLDLIERITAATGETIRMGSIAVVPTGRLTVARDERLARAIGDYRFDPWDRDPTPAEQRSLRREEMKREGRGSKTAAAGRTSRTRS
ncbi:MAG: helix-turn-helix domain-containing protein [Actinobacteria bacterium]|nr:MAG: helix-turn-helix domain-containing protein [Actinomycetota bacterium]